MMSNSNKKNNTDATSYILIGIEHFTENRGKEPPYVVYTISLPMQQHEAEVYCATANNEKMRKTTSNIFHLADYAKTCFIECYLTDKQLKNSNNRYQCGGSRHTLEQVKNFLTDNANEAKIQNKTISKEKMDEVKSVLTFTPPTSEPSSLQSFSLLRDTLRSEAGDSKSPDSSNLKTIVRKA